MHRRGADGTDNVLVISADHEDILLLENALEDLPGVALREPEPYGGRLNSSAWQTIAVSLTSATSVAAARSVIVEMIRSRKIHVKITEGFKTFEYTGPLTDDDRLTRLSNGIKAVEPPPGDPEPPVPPAPR